MRKVILYLIFITGVDFCYGMLPQDRIINGTKIRVSHDDLHKRVRREGMQDITIIGEHEQRFLEGDLTDCYYVGDLVRSAPKSMLVKSKSLEAYLNVCCDSNKLLVNHRFAGYKNYCEIFKLEFEPAYKINIDSVVVKVIEPKLLKSIEYINYKDVFNREEQTEIAQYVYPKIVCRNSTPVLYHYFDQDALEKALDDLKQCYGTVLENAYHLFTEQHQEKSIAFSFLSSLLGIPKDEAAKAAVASFIKFLTNDFNKGKYRLIEVVVEQEKDVDLFEKYLNWY